jgi:tetratricopeptide (TPR) repeat protein
MKIQSPQFTQYLLFQKGKLFFQQTVDPFIKNALQNYNSWEPSIISAAAESIPPLPPWLCYAQSCFNKNYHKWVHESQPWDTFIILQVFSSFIRLIDQDAAEEYLRAHHISWYRNFDAHSGRHLLTPDDVVDAFGAMRSVMKSSPINCYSDEVETVWSQLSRDALELAYGTLPSPYSVSALEAQSLVMHMALARMEGLIAPVIEECDPNAKNWDWPKLCSHMSTCSKRCGKGLKTDSTRRPDGHLSKVTNLRNHLHHGQGGVLDPEAISNMKHSMNTILQSATVMKGCYPSTWLDDLEIKEVGAAVEIEIDYDTTVAKRNIPLSLPGSYVDRVEEVECIVDALLNDHARVLVHGVPGVGKDVLAIKVLRDSRIESLYQRQVFWLLGSSLSSFKTGLREFGVNHCRTVPTDDIEVILGQVYLWLSSHEGWILYIEDLDVSESDFVQYIPSTGKGRIILTSMRDWNGSSIGITHRTQVEGFTFKQSMELLRKMQIKREDQSDANVLRPFFTNVLGNLPLSVSLNAHSMRSEGWSAQELVENVGRLSVSQEEIDSKGYNRIAQSAHIRGVVASIRLALDRLTRSCSDAAELSLSRALLLLLAILPRGNTSILLFNLNASMLTDMLPHSREDLLQDLVMDICSTIGVDTSSDIASQNVCQTIFTPEGFDRALAVLSKMGLLQQGPNLTIAPTLHQEICRYIIREEEYKNEQQVYRTLVNLTDFLLQSFANAKVAHGLRRTIVNCYESIEGSHCSLGRYFTDARRVTLALRASRYCLHGAVNYSSAQKFANLALDLQNTKYGGADAVHPNIAVRLHIMGHVYSARGQYLEAIRHHDLSLVMQHTLYGRDAINPGIAATLGALGDAYRNLGQFKEAMSFFESALEVEYKLQSSDATRSSIAATLSAMGDVHRAQGRYKEAMDRYRSSLKIKYKLHGADVHPEIAATLHAMGHVYRAQGMWVEAMGRYRSALDMHHTLHGADAVHPEIAATLHGMGDVYRAQGHYEEAMRHCELALEMQHSLHGGADAVHPDITGIWHTMGDVYSDQGQNEKAIGSYESALKMHGADAVHPDIATTLHAMGDVYCAQRQYEQAMGSYRSSLKIRYTLHGADAVSPEISAAKQAMRALCAVLKAR